MSTPAYTHEHIRALDGLRGHAALAVTFYHAILFIDTGLVQRAILVPAAATAAPDWPARIALSVFNGEAAVMLFYALSGYVLCVSLQRDAATPRTLSLFFMRRVLRLLPALVACLGVMWLLAQVYAAAGVSGFPAVGAGDAARNALLIDTHVHGPSTSVQIEALATPFIVLTALALRGVGVVAGVLAVAWALISIEAPWLLLHLPHLQGYLFVFLLGVTAAAPALQPALRAAPSWALPALLAAGLALRPLLGASALSGLITQGLLFAAAVGVAAALQPGSALLRALQHPVSLFLGRISYSYYLFNVAVLWVLWFSPALACLPRLGALIGGLVTGLLAVLLTVPVAALSQRWVERPCMALGRRASFAFAHGGVHAA